MSLPVQHLEIHIILFIQVVGTSDTVLHGGRKSNVRRRLREVERVELIIFDRALDYVRGGNIDLSDLSAGDSCLGCEYGSLKMVFLRKVVRRRPVMIDDV